MTTGKPFVPFDEDEAHTEADRKRTIANNEKVLREVVRHGFEGRDVTATDVAQWHRDLLDGLSYVPDPCYLGGYRGSIHPWLVDYEVQVGGVLGVPAGDVAHALEEYFKRLTAMIEKDLRSIPLDHTRTADQVQTIAVMAAIAHGEWVRIHPFANGNGRTARLIANYVLARFRMRPVVRIRPRPDSPFDLAASDSMTGDHLATILWLLSLIDPNIVSASQSDDEKTFQ